MSCKWVPVSSPENYESGSACRRFGDVVQALRAGEEASVLRSLGGRLACPETRFFVLQAAQSASPTEEKKHRGKKLQKEPEIGLAEHPEHKHRDPDPRYRERVAERDGNTCREAARGERGREQPRERRRDARDWDRGRLLEKSREQDADKPRNRGKDREKDRDRQARKEQPRPAGAQRDLLGGAGQEPERSRRAGACPRGVCAPSPRGSRCRRVCGARVPLVFSLAFHAGLALHLVTHRCPCVCFSPLSPFDIFKTHFSEWKE